MDNGMKDRVAQALPMFKGKLKSVIKGEAEVLLTELGFYVSPSRLEEFATVMAEELRISEVIEKVEFRKAEGHNPDRFVIS